jgi:hypothetical protein
MFFWKVVLIESILSYTKQSEVNEGGEDKAGRKPVRIWGQLISDFSASYFRLFAKKVLPSGIGIELK